MSNQIDTTIAAVANATATATDKKAASKKPAADKNPASKKVAVAVVAEKKATTKTNAIFHQEFLRLLGKALKERCTVTEEGYTTCSAEELASDPGVIEAASKCKIFNKDLIDAIQEVVGKKLEKADSVTIPEIMESKGWNRFGVQIDQMKILTSAAISHTPGIEAVRRVGVRKTVGKKDAAAAPSHTLLKLLISVAGRLQLISGIAYSRGQGMGFYPASVK